MRRRRGGTRQTGCHLRDRGGGPSPHCGQRHRSSSRVGVSPRPASIPEPASDGARVSARRKSLKHRSRTPSGAKKITFSKWPMDGKNGTSSSPAIHKFSTSRVFFPVYLPTPNSLHFPFGGLPLHFPSSFSVSRPISPLSPFLTPLIVWPRRAAGVEWRAWNSSMSLTVSRLRSPGLSASPGRSPSNRRSKFLLLSSLPRSRNRSSASSSICVPLALGKTPHLSNHVPCKKVPPPRRRSSRSFVIPRTLWPANSPGS